MLVCQWHFDIPFGKQGAVVEILQSWFAENLKSSEFKRGKTHRLLVGHVGASASHIVTEHTFDSLEDFEAAINSMGNPAFQKHAEALAPYVVPGTQHWEILRVVMGG